MKELYSVLGVSRDADQATIKKAFKQLARKYHPDVNKDTSAEERFKEVSAAYEVLGDEQRRALYDEFGEESLRVGFDADRARAWKNMAGGAGRGAPGGFGGGAGPGFGGGVRFEDIFGGLGGMGGFGGMGGTGHEPGPRRGADIEGHVGIGLLDAIRGTRVDITVARPSSCPDCHGEGGTGRKPCAACGGRGRRTVRQFGLNALVSCEECGGEGSVYERECDRCGGTGRIRTRETLTVHIPAGVADGQVLRLRGKGGEGHLGGPAGDLLLAVKVADHPRLHRTGNDLEMDLPITLTEAIGGGPIEVSTPGGRLRVKIPAASQNGTRLRLAGKGVPSRGGPGDLYLVLRPMIPDAKTDEAVELARKLDELGDSDVRAGLDL